MTTIACGCDRDALCHPYYPCSRCGLDFDDETFYRVVQKRRGDGLHAIRHRHRLHDTICIGCRQEERDRAKGPSPVIDWAAVERGRFVNAARRTLDAHAQRYKRSRHDFQKAGWLIDVMAKRMATTSLCEYCEHPF